MNKNRTTVLDICHLPLEIHSPPFLPTCAPGGVLYASVPLSPSGFLLALTSAELWKEIEGRGRNVRVFSLSAHSFPQSHLKLAACLDHR